jgi:hypothetical protein
MASGPPGSLLKGPRAANAVARDGRPRLDGVIGWSRSAARQAAPQMGDRASADSLRWNLDLVLDQRGADMVDLPGGASGLLARDYKGKETDTGPRGAPRRSIDPGVVSLVAELCGHERQAAEELEQMSQALNRLRATASLPKDSPPMPWPPTGGRGWMAGSAGVESAPWQSNVPDLQGRRAQGSSPGYVRLANQRKTPSGGHHSWQADLAPGICHWRQIRGLGVSRQLATIRPITVAKPT